MSTNADNMGASLDHADNKATDQEQVENTNANQAQSESTGTNQVQPDDAGQLQTDREEKLKEDDQDTEGTVKVDKLVSVGTSTVIVETQEVVSSSTSVNHEPKPSGNKMRSVPRRASYQASRGYAGNYQNYGLAYLPYKSNFEPSEDARRRADEFLKTLRL